MIFLLGVALAEVNPYEQGLSHKIESEFENAGNDGCTAMNTYLLSDGKCACVEGFLHGDPNDSRGCFNCSEECHVNGECGYPGRCRCKPGFSGNGFNCEAPVPALRFVEPEHVPINVRGRVNATIILDVELDIPGVFCRFGEAITSGRMITNSIIECDLPPKDRRSVNSCGFYVSLDNISWSKEYVMFSFDESIHDNSWIGYVLISVGIVIIAVALYLIFQKEPEQIEEADEAETTPFVKQNQNQ